MHLYASTPPVTETPLAALLRDPSTGAHRIQVPAKATIYKPDDPANSIYYIHQGQVRTYQIAPNGSRRLVEILGNEQWCGVAAMAEAPAYGEVAEAAVPTTLSVVSAERLFAMLPHDASVAIGLIHELAQKLGTYREDASGLVFEDCQHRLIRTLLHLSESPAASPMADGVVLKITHQQLAQKVGVARETISLALAQLRRQDVLRTGRNQLFFNPKTLAAQTGNGHAASNGQE